MIRKLFLALYYGFAQYLPDSYTPVVGPACNAVRVYCCKRISTVGRRAYFGNGRNVEIGDGSGIGPYCTLPNNIRIGENVMMGPEVLIFRVNHRFDIPGKTLGEQGVTENPPVEIGSDVWLGQRVIVTAGRKIAPGSIVAAGAVVTKDFPPYKVIGGNPAKIIKDRYANS